MAGGFFDPFRFAQGATGGCAPTSAAVDSLVTTLLNRIRDPLGQGTTSAQVRTVLTQSVRALNLQREWSLQSKTLSTQEGQAFYQISALDPNIGRVVNVREGGRDLHWSEWKLLSQGQSDVLAKRGTRFESFCLLGRDLLMLWPIQDQASSVEVVYATLEEPALAAACVDLSDQEIPKVLQLAESLLLARLRLVEMSGRVIIG